jgi:hypothetical protein
LAGQRFSKSKRNCLDLRNFFAGGLKMGCEIRENNGRRDVMRRFLRILKNALLLVVFPVLWWGPVVHPHINGLALKKAKKMLEEGDDTINENMVRRLDCNKDTFLFAGNSADAISTYHILNKISIYDYAHNSIPNDHTGIPHFGYTLIDEWLQADRGERAGIRYSEKDFAIACGWLAHQVADWYPHYAAVDKDGQLVNDGYGEPDKRTIFPGFANSHRMLGADYYPEILNNYVLTDHGIIELFYDLLVMRGNEEFYDHNRVELFEVKPGNETKNLLTIVSERYFDQGVRVPPEDIPVLEETFNSVIRGIQVLIEILTLLRPNIHTAIDNAIKTTTGGLDYFINLSVDRIVEQLFRKSDDDISALANQSVNIKIDDDEVKRPGSILFPLAGKLGSIIDLNSLLPLLRGAEKFKVPFEICFFKICFIKGSINLPAALISHVKTFVRAKSASVLSKDNHETNALISFIEELLIDDNDNLSVPVKKYKDTVQPVVMLDSTKPDVDAINEMFQQQEILIRIIPATSPDNPETSKLLNQKQLLFRIDGYNIKAKSWDYDLKEEFRGDDILHLTCNILEKPKEGTHHILVDIRDNNQIQSNSLEYEIPVE